MIYAYRYSSFKDYFEEIENYCLRLERFHEEFSEVPYERRKRMIEWLEASFRCGREKDFRKEKND